MLFCFCLGMLIGLTLALTGAGGGIIAVPLLVFALHLDIAEAAPVGLVAVGLASGVGALLGLREGRVRYRAAMLIGGVGVVMAPVGVWMAQRVPNGPLSIAFALAMAFSARAMYRNSSRSTSTDGSVDTVEEPRRQPPCVLSPATGRLIWTKPCAAVLAATGIGSGFLSGLLGVGGGFVIVPTLTRFSDLATDRVVSTSLAVIALVSASGVASAVVNDSMPWPIAMPFALGATGALLVARQAGRRLSGPTVQRCFALLSAAVAVALVVQGLHDVHGVTRPG